MTEHEEYSYDADQLAIDAALQAWERRLASTPDDATHHAERQRIENTRGALEDASKYAMRARSLADALDV